MEKMHYTSVMVFYYLPAGANKTMLISQRLTRRFIHPFQILNRDLSPFCVKTKASAYFIILL